MPFIGGFPLCWGIDNHRHFELDALLWDIAKLDSDTKWLQPLHPHQRIAREGVRFLFLEYFSRFDVLGGSSISHLGRFFVLVPWGSESHGQVILFKLIGNLLK